ncbi:MAG: hemolysin family protein [Planctomycetaceae bacterium]|nr:hemolysin family protein [Planctomycetaceae bacterium]
MLELTLTCLFLSCVAAVGASSFAEFSLHQLQELCQRRSAGERFAAIRKHHERTARAVLMFQCFFLCATLIFGLYWWTMNREYLIAVPTPDWFDWILKITVPSLILIACTVWIPSTLASLWATPIIYFFWPFWSFLMVCAVPLEMVARFCDAIFFRLAGYSPDTSEEEQFSEEIRTIVSEGHREGLLEDEARGMIEGIMDLSSVVVSEVMTPRTDICSMPKSLSWEEMLAFVIKTPHSRIPVYDTNRDDIIGILIAKDLLPELAKVSMEYRASWTTLLREPVFVPETKPVASLLHEFQTNHSHLVIVLDEYGGVSGIATLEDIIEEIVGEIVDEYDPDLIDNIEKISENTYLVLGRIHIDDINERLRIKLPDDQDYDTLAGFLLDQFEHVPVNGEFLDFENFRITVAGATPRRIEKVRIEPIPEK